MALSKPKNRFRNAAVLAGTVTVAVALAAFEWAYIWQTVHAKVTILGREVELALVESVIITGMGLMALTGGFVAAQLRQDPRRDIRRMAGGAQALAIVLLLPGVAMAGNSFAYPGQVASAAAYKDSDQYDTDVQNSRDHSLSSDVSGEAARRLANAISPSEARFDFWAWAFAAFLYGGNLASASLFWLPEPETPSERKRREAKETRAERRAAERRKMLTQAEAEAIATGGKPKWFRFLIKNTKAA